VISGFTTSCAPPETEPETSWMAPLDLVKALIAGPEPMNATSSELPSSALTSSGPALKVWVVSFVEPRFWAKKPFFTPISAGACVTFGKNPSRTSVAAPWFAAGAAEVSAREQPASTPTTVRAVSAEARKRVLRWVRTSASPFGGRCQREVRTVTHSRAWTSASRET
jgi:hypothetical protein